MDRSLPSLSEHPDFEWIEEKGILGLFWRRLAKSKPLIVNFSEGRELHRLSTSRSRQQLFARALGFKGAPYCVWDLTAGLGGDSLSMVAMGCKVVAIERSPVVFELLMDGWRRAQLDTRLKRILIGELQLTCQDAREFLLQLSSGDVPSPDAVYLDPMFPDTGKTALSPKKMQMLQALIGEETDTEALLQICQRMKVRRVVMKRPLRAAPIGSPTHSFRGTTVRYDVYIQ